MNYFLMLIIVGLCCGGYYEFTILQGQHAGDVQRLSDLQAKLDPLTADNAKLAADNAALKKSSTEAETEVADLTQQLQTAQTAAAEAKMAAVAPTSVAAVTPGTTAATPTPAFGLNLGTITTVDGKSYLNCQLLKVQPDGIVVKHSAGISQVAYSAMQPDLQKVFGFDPHGAPTLTDNQVAVLEAKRKAAGAN